MKHHFINILAIAVFITFSGCARPVGDDDLKGAVITEMGILFYNEKLYENNKFTFGVTNLESIYQKEGVEKGKPVMIVKYRCNVWMNDGKNKTTVRYEGVMSFIRKSGGHLPNYTIEKPKIVNDVDAAAQKIQPPESSAR